MSYPNNDPFIAGAYGSDTTDDFLRITDDAIDQAHPAAERVWQGQSEKTSLFHIDPHLHSPVRTPKPSANNYTASTSIPSTTASAPPQASSQSPPAMNTNNDQLTADEVGHAIMNSLAIQDSTLTPKQFKGTSVELESTEKWLTYFNTFCEFRNIRGKPKLQFFNMLLVGEADDWLRSQPEATRSNFDTLIAAFRARYSLSDIDRWKTATALLSREQSDTESVAAYITAVRNAAKIIPINDATLLRYIVIKGLRPPLRLHVLQTAANDLESVIRAAQVAETAHQAAVVPSETKELSAQINKLLSKLDLPAPAPALTPAPVPSVAAVETPREREEEPRRVRFSGDRRASSPSPARRYESSERRQEYRQEQYENRPRSSSTLPQSRQQNMGNRQYNTNTRYDNGQRERLCYRCNRSGHIQRNCRVIIEQPRPMKYNMPPNNQYSGQNCNPNYYQPSQPSFQYNQQYHSQP